MLGTYSYNEIFRKTIVSFGTLFNNIEIRRSDEVMKVPLAYGPKQKFLARLDQNPDPTNKRVQITLPRLSFEINDISYDYISFMHTKKIYFNFNFLCVFFFKQKSNNKERV